MRKRLLKALTLWLVLCTLACEEQPTLEDLATWFEPIEEIQDAGEGAWRRKSRLIRFRQGLPPQKFVGKGEIHLSWVEEDKARIGVEYPVAKRSRFLDMIVRENEIVPIAGKFHRLVETHYAPGSHRGSSYIVMDSKPAKPRGVKLRRGSLAVPLEALAEIADYDNEDSSISSYDIEVLEIAGSTAKLNIWPIGELELAQFHSVKVGDKLVLEPFELTILSVVPSNAKLNLRGFVEVRF